MYYVVISRQPFSLRGELPSFGNLCYESFFTPSNVLKVFDCKTKWKVRGVNVNGTKSLEDAPSFFECSIIDYKGK